MFHFFFLFLFLGVFKGPTRNIPEMVRDTIRTSPEKTGNPPVWETTWFTFSTCKLAWKKKFMPHVTGRPGCWTMELNGGSSASYLSRAPCVPLFSTLFTKGGNRRAFRLPGEGGDHLHCAEEPSPGHIRCRRECQDVAPGLTIRPSPATLERRGPQRAQWLNKDCQGCFLIAQGIVRGREFSCRQSQYLPPRTLPY